MRDLTLINNLTPLSSFEAYKNYVKNISLMTEEEQIILATKLKVECCINSAQQLILSQLTLCYI